MEEKTAIRWGKVSFKGNAEKVYYELVTLGEYTPDDVVTYARQNPGSELYKCFDWDDTSAAEKWRRHTARLITCSLCVDIADKTGESMTAYRILEHDDVKKVYQPVQITVRRPDEYKQLLKQAKAELGEFKKRYAKIVELASIIEEIDALLNN